MEYPVLVLVMEGNLLVLRKIFFRAFGFFFCRGENLGDIFATFESQRRLHRWERGRVMRRGKEGGDGG